MSRPSAAGSSTRCDAFGMTAAAPGCGRPPGPRHLFWRRRAPGRRGQLADQARPARRGGGRGGRGGPGLPAVARPAGSRQPCVSPRKPRAVAAAAAPGPAVILVASVYEAAAARLEAAVAEISATRHRPIRQRRIRHADLPLSVSLPEPDRVGIDRLAGSRGGRPREAGRAPPPSSSTAAPPPPSTWFRQTGRFSAGRFCPDRC